MRTTRYSEPSDAEFDRAMEHTRESEGEPVEDEVCEYCGDGDRVPQGAWVCPKCDAEWPDEEGEDQP